MEIRNPATNKIIKSVESDTPESLAEKFKTLQKAQALMLNFSVQERVTMIARFRDLLNENIETLAKDLSLEMGKPLQEAQNEIKGAAHRMKFFIEQGADLLKPEKVNTAQGTDEVLAYDPLGVVCNISAWNYPYVIAVNVLIPSIICGNTNMYKPSEFSTLSGMHFRNLLIKAGVPEQALQIAIGDGDVGRELLDMDFDAFAFTGSYRTGKIIAETVAHKLVPVILELGGKDPLYVTELVDDLKATAEAAADGAFYNNGQSCCSVERIYVHEKVYPEFIEHFSNYAKNLTVGEPLTSGSNQGAITQKNHLNYLQRQVEDAVEKGATLVTGGKVIESEGNFFEPTVLVDVNHTMNVMSEETFGPVIGVMKVKSDDEAIQLMNDTQYGLTSSVFCTDKERGKKLLTQINSGTGYLNCCDRVSGFLPWSGRKSSGLGSTLSKHGLYEFSQPKGLHFR